MTIVEAPRAVTGGVDTHLDLNVAAALDDIGGFARRRAVRHRRRRRSAAPGLAPVLRLALTAPHQAVGPVDLGSPRRRGSGPGRPVGASVGEGQDPGRQRGGDPGADGGPARRPGHQDQDPQPAPPSRLCAPEPLRRRFQGLTAPALALEAAALRPRADAGPVIFVTKTAMRTLSRRVAVLYQEKLDLDELLGKLVAETAPELLALHGVGTVTAAALLVAAGDKARALSGTARGTITALLRCAATGAEEPPQGRDRPRHKVERGRRATVAARARSMPTPMGGRIC